MSDKLEKLSNMGKKVTCPNCHNEWRPDMLKDKRCPRCRKDLEKEIERELER